MGRRPRSKTPFSTGTQRTHSVFRGPPVRTRLRRAHSASRAYGEGHGSKRQRLYPPLHGGKPYRSRWEALLPTHREHSTKARHTASFAPTARAAAANRSDGILHSTGESPTEADGKSPTHREYSAKARRKSMQDGESLPCGMSRHPSFLYINRNLLANATCFFL